VHSREAVLTHFLAWLLLAAALTAQVIPVSGGGAALANAVAAAPSGATLVVAFGTYDDFIVVDKDLTLVAPARATITGAIEATQGTLRRTLVLVNLDVTDVPGGFPHGYAAGTVMVADNLHMIDCTCLALQVGIPTPVPSCHCWLERCIVHGGYASNMLYANTALVDCSIYGKQIYSSTFGWMPQNGLCLVGSLRAERTQIASSIGATPSIAALGLWGPGTLAHCALNIGSPGSVGLSAHDQVTLWSTTIAGSTLGPTTTRLLATAQWSQRNWSVGGTSVATFREAPNTAAAVIVSFQLEQANSPFAAEPLWVGSTPWGVWSLGVTDAQGYHTAAVAIPNVPALQYTEAWLTGVFFDPIPLRTTSPIGGTIQ
jgi:hypothetical protein